MLEFEAVTKVYRHGVVGVRNITISIGRGIFGLLGPGGSGKTTLLQMAATLTVPTSGTIRFEGVNIAARPAEVRRALGYLPEEYGLYGSLTGYEFLLYAARLKGIMRRKARDRALELLARFELMPVKDGKIRSYSAGMKQRLGVAQALLNDPKLLLIDEPASRLGPAERAKLRDLLRELSPDRCVVVATHLVPDVEDVATELGLMRGGKIVANASPAGLISSMKGKVWEALVPRDRLPGLERHYVVSWIKACGENLEVRLVGDDSPGGTCREVPARLEDAYAYYVQRTGLVGQEANLLADVQGRDEDLMG